MHATTEDRVVAYVDVVGWGNAFATIGHDALVKAAREIADHKAAFSPTQKAKVSAWEKSMAASYEMTVLGGYHEINFSFVSDSFVVSAPKANLRGLLTLIKWACIRLLEGHGFLTRGGISVGRFTHDMEHDIAVGKPLVEAVEIEKYTSMPRITLSPEARQLTNAEDFAKLIYFDGEQTVLNISNGSESWLEECNKRIVTALASGLDERKIKKWKYLAEHLPKMAEAHRAA